MNEVCRDRCRILLCSGLGRGKTSLLKSIYKTIATNFDKYGVIPLFVDASEITFHQDPIISYLLTKYSDKLTDGDKQTNVDRKLLLKECFNSDKYKFLLIIDSTELLNECLCENMLRELKHFNKFKSISIIFSTSNSAFKDNDVFIEYKIVENYGRLDETQILNYLKKNGFEVDHLSLFWQELLNSPFYLTKFVKTHIDSSVLNTDMNFDKSKLIEEYLFEFVKLNSIFNEEDEFEKRKNLIFNIIPEKVYYSNDNHIKLSSLEYGKYVNSIPAIDVVKSNDTFYSCEISHVIYLQFFKSKYVENYINTHKVEDCIEFLNEFIYEGKILLFIGEQLNITNENRTSSKLYECLKYLRLNHSKLDVTKYQVAVCNILGVFINTCSDQLSALDLSYLDLRECDFIGVNCSNTNFSNSYLTDECFVPVEPKKPNIFSISKNGEYYLTGDESAINIRYVNKSKLLYRTLSDNGNEFISAKSIDDNNFCVTCKNNLIVLKIDENQVSQIIRPLTEIDVDDKINKIELSKDILSKGKICCIENEFALVKSDAGSLHGCAYLLYDINKKTTLSVHKIFSQLEIDYIVQDGEEIEFLYPYEEKCLKSICYNETTKEIYYKQYPSFMGRFISYDNGIKICFNTDKFNVYLKYYFFDKKLLKYNKNMQENDLQNAIPIGSVSTTDLCPVNIITKKTCWVLTYLKHNYLLIDGYVFRNKFGFNLNSSSTAENKFIYFDRDDASCKICVYSKAGYKLIYSLELKNKINVVCSSCINVYDDKSYGDILLSNSFVKLDESKKTFSISYKIDLEFDQKYDIMINSFPWEKIVNEIYSVWNANRNKNELRRKCDELVSLWLNQNCQGVETSIIFDWTAALISYIHLFIVSNYSEGIEDEDYVFGIKNWCFPIDDGIIYYDGEYTCYKTFNGRKIKFSRSFFVEFNSNVHFFAVNKSYNILNSYKLYDIYKDVSHNRNYGQIIPIYDLNLHGALFDETNGLTEVVKDIIEKQTNIETRYITYDN